VEERGLGESEEGSYRRGQLATQGGWLPASGEATYGTRARLQSELFRDNLRRYLGEEPLVNELDKMLLY
jgi:hypothetical protein